MKTLFVKKYLYICLLLCLMPAVSNAAISRDSITLTNGKLSVKLRQAPFEDVVKIISEKTGTHIYLFDDTGSRTITVEFSDRQLEPGLRSIFKEVNYAVVYQDDRKKGEVSWPKNINKKNNSIRASQSLVSGRSKGVNRNAASSVNTPSTIRISNQDSSGVSAGSRTASPSFSPNNGLNRTSEKISSQNSKVTNNSVYNNGAYRTNDSSSSSNVESTGDESESIYDAELNVEETTGETTFSEDDSENTSENLVENNDEKSIPHNPDYDKFPWYHEGMSTKEFNIRFKIYELENQIASGYADSNYEQWVQRRGDRVVRHAIEILDDYDNRLEELLDK